MAKTQRMTIDLTVQTSFKDALSQVQKLQEALKNLKLPTDMTAQLQKDFAAYEKSLQKLATFQPNTGNIASYSLMVDQLSKNYDAVSASMQKVGLDASKYLGSTAAIDKQVDAVKRLQEQLASLDKQAIQTYFNLNENQLTDPAARKTARQGAMDNIKSSTAEGSAERQAAIAQYNQMSSALKQYATIVTKTQTAENALTNATKEQAASTAVARTAIDNMSNSVSRLAPVQEQAATSAHDLTEQFNQLAQAQKADDLGNTLKRLTAFGVAVRFARQQLQEMKTTYLDLDAGLTQIAVVSGRTRDEMWGMIGTYNEMAQRLGATTQQVVESSKLYFQQGRTQSDVMRLVEETTKLAAISELDFAQATDYMTAAINGFKLAATDAANVTDVWANLAAKAAVDTQELAVAISKVASLAEGAGMSIESTSALLTKMIETTREAPENLGTALKTIIARFQELKDLPDSGVLEDGIDANKVEKALRTAGVALRDARGEFRDFDDVIMELSSKWDGLSRSQQRYIATVAAGARQQSRFIAMVDDYQRNVQLMDIAQNSAGAGTAQFAVQLTGLEASMNRLQSAWEGLYTSLNNGHSIVTGLIEGLASVVSAAGKMGIGFTAVAAIITFLGIKMGTYASATIAAALAKETLTVATVKSTLAEGGFAAVLKLATGATWGMVKATLAQAAATAIAYAPLILIIVALGALIAVIVAVATAQERHIEKLREQSQEYENVAAKAQQEASSVKTLLDQYEQLVKTGQDTADVKQQLIDQFPDAIAGLDMETASTRELTAALQEYMREQQKIAAQSLLGKMAVDQQLIDEETFNENYDRIWQLQEAMNQLYGGSRTGYEVAAIGENGKSYDPMLADIGGQVWDEDAKMMVTITSMQYEYNGKTFDSVKGIEDEMRAQVEELSHGEPIEITRQIALTLAPQLQDQTNEWSDLSKQYYAALLDGIDDISSIRVQVGKDAEGNPIYQFTEEFIKQAQDGLGNLEIALRNASDKEKEIINNFLSGSFGDLTAADLDILNKFFPPEMVAQFTEYLDRQAELIIAAFDEFGIKIRDGVNAGGNVDLQNSLLDALVNSEGTEMEDAVRAYVNHMLLVGQQAVDEAIGQIDSENQQSLASILGIELTGDEVEDMELLTGNLTNMLESLDPTNIEDVTTALQALTAAGLEDSDMAKTLAKLASQIGMSFDDTRDALAKYAKDMKKVESLTDKAVDTVEELEEIFSDYGLTLRASDFEQTADGFVLTEEGAQRAYDAIMQLDEAHRQAAVSAAVAAQGAYLASLGLDGEAHSAALAAFYTQLFNGTLTAADANALIVACLSGEMSLQELADALNMDIALVQQLFGALQGVEGAAPQEIADQLTSPGWLAPRPMPSGGGGRGGGGGGGGGKSAADEALEAEKKYVEQLKKTADQLKKVADEEQKIQEKRIKMIQKVLQKRQDALEKENELLEKQIDQSRETEEIQLEAFQRYLEKRIKAFEDALAALEKAADKAKKAAETNNDDLNFQNEVVQQYYKDQIQLIDDQIEALKKKNEEENLALKLAQAQDAYERSRESQNRLVLVRGAGWVWQRDREQLEKARKELKDVQREVTIADLEKEKAKLQEQADAWAEKAKNIGKTTEELEKFAKIYKEFSNMTAADRDKALEAFAKAVLENNKLNQEALDAERKLEFESDEDAVGSIAAQIKQLEEWSEKVDELLDKVGMDYDEYIRELKIEAALDNLGKLFDSKPIESMLPHLQNLTTATQIYMNNLLIWGAQIKANEAEIEKIEEAMDAWDDILDDLGKSTSELNEEMALFNQYNAQATDQLGKGSAVWQQAIADAAKLAEMWEAANNAQKAYEAAQEAYDAKAGGSYAGGGPVTYTGLAKVHGTAARPELFLNNAQVTSLWNFLDGIAGNPFAALGRAPVTIAEDDDVVSEDNRVYYNNCTFEVSTDANNIDDLIKDVQRQSPLKKF